MAPRPVIRGSANDLMTQQNAAATARFRQPPRPPSSAPASFTTNGPPPPPAPVAQTQQAGLRRELNPATAISRAEPAFARTLPAPAATAIAQQGWGSPPAPGYRPAPLPAGGVDPGLTRGDRLPPSASTSTTPRTQFGNPQDMVDVPGFGQMPRSLLQNLQQRMQQRQQPQQPGPSVSLPNPGPKGAQPPIDWANMQQTPQPYFPPGGARPNDNRFGPPVSAGPGATTGARWTTAGQGPNMITNPAWRGPAPVDPGFDRPYRSDNPFGPPVGGRPSMGGGGPAPGGQIDLWRGGYTGQPQPGYVTPYGNDNLGGGVTRPTMLSQPPAAAPPPPPLPTLNDVPQTPAPGFTPPPLAAPTSINQSLLNAASPEITSLQQYQMMTPGATPSDFAAYQAAYRNRSMTGPGAPPPPPPPAPSPFAAQNWGGGPAAFGAGPNPNPWAGPGTSPYFGPSMPNLPPAAQQSYQQAWANDLNRDPYQTGGAVVNGMAVTPPPSWY